MITVFCDGLCEPINPGGTACYGWVIYKDGNWIAEGKGVCPEMGKLATNNVAEYSAALAALEYLLSNGLTSDRVIVKSDSKLIVNTLSGYWAIKAEHLKILYNSIKDVERQLSHVGYQWIPREENTEADALSREAMQ